MSRAALALLLGLVIAGLCLDAAARVGMGGTVGFSCRRNPSDLSLICDTTGLSDGRRAPDWFVAEPDGRLVDRARGWYAVDLWPTAGEPAVIVLQARPAGRFVQLRCTAAVGGGCGARE